MAQKISPKSLRAQKLLSHNYSIYGEHNYSNLWIKGYELASLFFIYINKNRVHKIKRWKTTSRRSGKGIKIKFFPEYLIARFYLSSSPGFFKFSPILFKFARRSLSKKYNPIKVFPLYKKSKVKKVYFLKQKVQKKFSFRKFHKN